MGRENSEKENRRWGGFQPAPRPQRRGVVGLGACRAFRPRAVVVCLTHCSLEFVCVLTLASSFLALVLAFTQQTQTSLWRTGLNKERLWSVPSCARSSLSSLLSRRVALARSLARALCPNTRVSVCCFAWLTPLSPPLSP